MSINGTIDQAGRVALHLKGGSFLSTLKHADLARLRRVVKAEHMRFYPTEKCTDREADRIIEALGPSVAEKMIRRAVDAKL